MSRMLSTLQKVLCQICFRIDILIQFSLHFSRKCNAITKTRESVSEILQVFQLVERP
jgi:hypothetical protein